MSSSLLSKSSTVLHAIAITAAIALLSGHLQLKIKALNPTTEPSSWEIQLSINR